MLLARWFAATGWQFDSDMSTKLLNKTNPLREGCFRAALGGDRRSGRIEGHAALILALVGERPAGCPRHPAADKIAPGRQPAALAEHPDAVSAPMCVFA
jgi:hypothetical protein